MSLIKFKRQLSNDEKNKLTQKLKSIDKQGTLEEHQWWLDKQIFQNLYLQKMFQEIQQSRITSLRINHNPRPNLITFIKHIGFPNLKFFFLTQNVLSSIQPLLSINMPSLTQLGLYRNNLTSIKPVSRISMNLQYLSLHENKISEYDVLSQLCTKKLKILRLQRKLPFIQFGRSSDCLMKMAMPDLVILETMNSNSYVITDPKNNTLKTMGNFRKQRFIQ